MIRKNPENSEEIMKYEFKTQKDFENNFGKENWLSSYQKAEIDRNSQQKLTEKYVQILGADKYNFNFFKLPDQDKNLKENSISSSASSENPGIIFIKDFQGTSQKNRTEILNTMELFNSIRDKFIKTLKNKK